MNSTTVGFVPPLNQIAFSVVDLRLTERWFREGFGLQPAGGTRALMRGPLAARVQGLPRAASTCWWLVGRNSWFQLELFQFERPIATLMPADRRPCDIGYTRIGIWVENFDTTLEKLARLGSPPLTAPQGDTGRRRACVRNPDGVYVEIMEDDPLPHLNKRGRLDCPAAIRSVTLSVPQLADAAALFETGIGLKPSQVILHTPEHEALWGLPGATTQTKVFDGGDVLVEVVHYLDPVGKPWPNGYRVSDQGILNIAFGAHSKQDFDTVYQRAQAFGAKPNWRPFHHPGAGVVYVNDKHDFSVEIMWTKPGLVDQLVGFDPRPLHKRPDPDNRRIQHRVTINAPADVWDAINDQDTMAQWIGFDPVTVRRQGWTQRHGAGSERLMQGPPGVGQIVEQVIAVNPQHSVRYRVIEGSPLANHQGEITVKERGGRTEVHWSIRFRPKFAGTGALLQRILQRRLRTMLDNQFKPHIESRYAVSGVEQHRSTTLGKPMSRFDITQTNIAVERLIETTTNPRHLYLLHAYNRHRYLEIAGRFEEIFAPDMTVEKPVYHFNLLEMSITLDGVEAVKEVYREWAATNQCIFYGNGDEKLAVSDHMIVSTSTIYQQTPGTVLAAAGAPVDPDATYLTKTAEHMIWPYDDQGRLIGEDVWEYDPSVREIIPLDPSEVLTVEQAAKRLAPLIKPVPAHNPFTS